MQTLPHAANSRAKNHRRPVRCSGVYAVLTTVFSLPVLLLGSTGAYAQTHDILSKSYPLERIEAIVEKQRNYDYYPTISDRDRWDSLSDPVRSRLIALGEAALDYEYDGLPASQLIEDTTNGDYGPSAGIQFEARRKLNDLVLAEAAENKGRFLPAIVDIVWRICEESSWPTLSHYYLHKEGDKAKLELALPDVRDPVVDLWAAETAKNLAWTVHLLGERFDDISPRINNRIRHEINRRVLEPAMQRDDFWWMGFSGGNRGIVNNWNPWISSNWLHAILLAEEPQERAAAIHKLLRVVDKFVNHYAEDGGVDEGPAYWHRAGGSLFSILATLYTWSDGEIDVFDNSKIRNIIAYIYRAHIHDRYVVNFTDAVPEFTPQVATLYNMGLLLDDERLTAFAASFATEADHSSRIIQFQTQGGRDLDHLMFPLFKVKEDIATGIGSAPYERDVWFEGIQQMIARSEEGSASGFFLAAKGGHNNESHNHNDVGSFIVYHNGLPVIIDAGPQSYNLRTFGEDRYSMWNTQSTYHSAPTINGEMQQVGAEFAAAAVEYDVNDAVARLSMDIAGAYPDAAAVHSWKREVELIRDRGVRLVDKYRLQQVRGETSLNFLTLREIERVPGGALLKMPDGADLLMAFDVESLQMQVEAVRLKDAVMKRSWKQDVLYRISLHPRSKARAGTVEVTFGRVDSN